jgi:hypothetical protein
MRYTVCVFITAGPSTKLFTWGAGGYEDMCYERRRAEACVDESAHHAQILVCPSRTSTPVFLFITTCAKACVDGVFI